MKGLGQKGVFHWVGVVLTLQPDVVVLVITLACQGNAQPLRVGYLRLRNHVVLKHHRRFDHKQSLALLLGTVVAVRRTTPRVDVLYGHLSRLLIIPLRCLLIA